MKILYRISELLCKYPMFLISLLYLFELYYEAVVGLLGAAGVVFFKPFKNEFLDLLSHLEGFF